MSGEKGEPNNEDKVKEEREVLPFTQGVYSSAPFLLAVLGDGRGSLFSWVEALPSAEPRAFSRIAGIPRPTLGTSRRTVCVYHNRNIRD